jgi:AraC-like DNA-binding protein
LSIWDPLYIHVCQYASLKDAWPVLGKSSALAGVVDRMGDWDIPCSDHAWALSIKAIPHSASQYRGSMVFARQFGPHRLRLPDNRHFATKLQTGVIIARTRGPVGMIVVRLKSETAAHVLGESIRHFLDTQVRLEDLFGAGQVSQLEQMLSEAKTSAERFACVETFLLANLRPSCGESVACRAAALLRRHPRLRISGVAARLDISERHLSRNFGAFFGMSAKQFARIARIERALLVRARGATWADSAHATGFADQAHLINDFTKLVGVSPGAICLCRCRRPTTFQLTGDPTHATPTAALLAPITGRETL